MIVRYEPWGAWIKLEDPAALVALDRAGVRALGRDGGDAWRDGDAPPSAPLEVHLAVTGRCAAGCAGCYLDATPDGPEPPREALLAALDSLRDAGVFTVAFGGGEPTTRADLDVLAEAARQRGITPVVTTSGLGMTPAKIARLRAFAQVNVSYDGARASYTQVRGFDGAQAAEGTITMLSEAGVRVGVNVVLTRGTFEELGPTLARAKSLGAVEAQLLRYKPAGRAKDLHYLTQRLTPAQGRALPGVLRALVVEHADLRVRIDCALVPFLSADPEILKDPARVSRLGILGCEAGQALAAVTVSGHVAPCSFAPKTSMRGEALAREHAGCEELAPWRTHHHAPAEPCGSCPLRAVCKGGCRIVARHLGGPDGHHAPDPECPRVLAYDEGKA